MTPPLVTARGAFVEMMLMQSAAGNWKRTFEFRAKLSAPPA